VGGGSVKKMKAFLNRVETTILERVTINLWKNSKWGGDLWVRSQREEKDETWKEVDIQREISGLAYKRSLWTAPMRAKEKEGIYSRIFKKKQSPRS